jgi:hypothetical protein
VEGQPDALEECYASDEGLQAQITEARAHPEVECHDRPVALRES